MNEGVLYALAAAAVTFAGFSGVVVVLPLRGEKSWSATEIRMLQLLIADSLVTLFLALLPVPLWLAEWPEASIWRLCSALLGSWFLVGDFMAIRGELRVRGTEEAKSNPVKRPIRYGIYLAALVMGVVLWLSALSLGVGAGQALYVLGLMVLLALAAVEFLFFIGLVLQQGRDA